MGSIKNGKREALRRLRRASCTAERLGDVRDILERETYVLGSLGILSKDLVTAAESIQQAIGACNVVATAAERTILDRRGGK